MSLLSYKIYGEGKAVVLLHGFMENHKMWDFLIHQNNDYQWIVIDLPGHGNSDNYYVLHSMEFMAEKVKQVLDIEKISSAAFVAHSMGGYVALAFLEKFPALISTLALFFSSPFEDTDEKKEQRLRAIDASVENLETFIKIGVPNLFNANLIEDLTDEIEQAKKWARETSLQGITAALLGMRERPTRSSIIQNTQIPILFIGGSFDSAVPTALIKQNFSHLPHISYKELPIGHMGHLEAPESCEKAILSFLTKNFKQ